MNISGTLNVFRLLRDPTLCLPQHTVSTFNHLPIPLSKAFPKKVGRDGEKEVDIQAVVLDKDNCFAVPHTDEVYQPYQVGMNFLSTLSMIHVASFLYSGLIKLLSSVAVT
jgi:phosphatidylglycerophosphatase GEP4